MTRKCIHENCKTKPNFNYLDKKTGLYCKKHANKDMVNVVSKKCNEKDCNKQQPIFNYINEKVGLFCKEHVKTGMVNVKNKKCNEEKCNTIPTFNYVGEKVGIYCQEHAKKDMINIKSKHCNEENCKTCPSFNYIGEKIGLYCKEHAKVGMVCIKGKRCEQENCKTLPSFNYKGEKTGLYCKEHAKAGMVDIKNKKCEQKNCNTIPNFNYTDEKTALFCKEHAKPGMVDVNSKYCLYENCKIRPSFNYINEKTALFCKEHSKIGMVDVKSKRCLECNDTQVYNKIYKGYCTRCFLYKFPNEKVSRNYKVKENHMTDFIKENFKQEHIIFDKQVDGGCSKRRPDLYIDKGTHVIIGECDENRHENTSCENKRMMELFQDFGNRPLVFIRFNPDAYINEHGEKILSSFKIHGISGVPIIRNKNEWENRLGLLKETMNYWLNVIPEKEITTEYLFYNF